MARKMQAENSKPRTRTKVKSGCRTCKLRKVKCDERWPVCQRCQSSGRVCEGYGVWGGGGNAYGQRKQSAAKDSLRPRSSSAEMQVQVVRNVPICALSKLEKQCFEWYMGKSALKLSGVFRSNNWTTILFQASTMDPAIMHAMLALGAAHKGDVMSTGKTHPSETKQLDLFTMAQYSKAIKSVQPRFSEQDGDAVRMALLVCLLFVNLEFLRGHYAAGNVHLRHGLNLLSTRACGGLSQSKSYFDGWIITLFTRILVQAKIFGQNLDYCRYRLAIADPGSHIEIFTSIHQARRSLEHLMLRVFDLRDDSFQDYMISISSNSLERTATQQQLLCELENWLHAQTATMRNIDLQRFIEPFAYLLLRLYHHMVTIMADTATSVENELAFDLQLPRFMAILDHCRAKYRMLYLAASQHPIHKLVESAGHSVSDIGWIGPLYYTAIKCRSHRLRLQAIKLLETLPHKEGIWDSELAVIVARKVMDMEEGGFFGHDELQDDFEMLALPTEEELALPPLPEANRFNNVQFDLPEDSEGTLQLRCVHHISPGSWEVASSEYDLPSQQWSPVLREVYVS